MSKSAFNLIEDELLVEEVSKNQVIYDNSHEKHKDLHYKEIIWNKISPIVGRSTDDCKKRWRNIRDTYMKHKRKPGTVSGTSKKKWALAENLSFLNNVIQYERNMIAHFNGNDSLIEDNTEDANEKFENNTIEKSVIESDFNEYQPPTKMSKIKNYQIDRASTIVESLQKPNEAIITYNTTTVDEIDLFFQSIAGIVKKLPPRGVTEARLEVLKTVSALEEKYSDNYY
ncbi:BESS motif,MADF domain,SANT/Myb domain,Myb-like domain [Cinara cedri]|uniref:BESS motif,MADF domain,SANT/Myb domain,Myb-like domain n=1 Tax=Cinara cedri TaxID=506608 RepID=A0A5E4N827_9HEMI|nr:BESS motif,MADF domain,SANT/Myb domain,Myb-like domain [Cinara cedri]